jgi:hypothetical protein
MYRLSGPEHELILIGSSIEGKSSCSFASRIGQCHGTNLTLNILMAPSAYHDTCPASDALEDAVVCHCRYLSPRTGSTLRRSLAAPYVHGLLCRLY